MNPMELIAQGIGLVAMVFNILSYQCKHQRAVIVMQLFGATLFSINFFLLGAYVGGLINAIGAVRAILFSFKDKFKADHILWLVGFILSYIGIYVLNFTIFGKEPTLLNLIIEILPIIGMTALSIGFRMKEASAIRKCGLVSSPSWLIYNVTVFNLGAIICEVLTLISIAVGMFRNDRKKAI